MNPDAIAKLRADVHALIAAGDDGEGVDPYALLIVLHKIEAQLDMAINEARA